MKKGTDKALDAFLKGDVQVAKDLYLQKYVTGKVPKRFEDKVSRAFDAEFLSPTEFADPLAMASALPANKGFVPK